MKDTTKKFFERVHRNHEKVKRFNVAIDEFIADHLPAELRERGRRYALAYLEAAMKDAMKDAAEDAAHMQRVLADEGIDG